MRSNKLTIVLKTLLAVGVLHLVFYVGVNVGQATLEPQTTTNTNTNLNTDFKPTVECRLVERHTVQYIEKPVTVVEYIEEVKRVPVKLRNFSGLRELEQWLEDKKNVTTIRFQSPNVTIDCDDYALEMQQKALADGYIMSFEVIGRSEYNSLFKTELPPTQSLHAINLVIIGNDAYYIEPQTSESVFAVHLD